MRLSRKPAVACLACVCVTLAVCLGGNAATAQARVSSPPPAALAPSSFSIGGAFCGLLKYPAKAATNRLIALMSAEEEDAVLAATLATAITKPLCKKGVSKLVPIVKRAVKKKPALKARIGPFAYNVVGTTVGQDRLVDRMAVAYSWFDPASRMRAAYPWVQVDGGRWTPFRTTVDVLRGSRVQFALRIDDFLNQSSPFAYSPVYVAS